MKINAGQVAIIVTIILFVIGAAVSAGRITQKVESLEKNMREDNGMILGELKEINRKLSKNTTDVVELKMWQQFLERMARENEEDRVQ